MSRGAHKEAFKGAGKLPPHLRFHTVPRDLCISPPDGWTCCGPVFVGALLSCTRKLILNWGLWPEEVQDQMSGVVVVSAVSATVEPETIFPWVGHWEESWRPYRLRPRKPRLLQFPRGHELGIKMGQSRQGELLVWPVCEAAAPLKVPH